MPTPPNSEDFRNALEEMIREARETGSSHLTVRSGDLHKKVGGYPDNNHRMRACCKVMYNFRKAGDRVVKAPPKCYGANLYIHYSTSR